MGFGDAIDIPKEFDFKKSMRDREEIVKNASLQSKGMDDAIKKMAKKEQEGKHLLLKIG